MPIYSIEELREKYGSNTKVLYCVIDDSANEIAKLKMRLNRDLNDDELQNVANMLEVSMGEILEESLATAVAESVKMNDDDALTKAMIFSIVETDSDGTPLEQEASANFKELESNYLFDEDLFLECAQLKVGDTARSDYFRITRTA